MCGVPVSSSTPSSTFITFCTDASATSCLAICVVDALSQARQHQAASLVMWLSTNKSQQYKAAPGTLLVLQHSFLFYFVFPFVLSPFVR